MTAVGFNEDFKSFRAAGMINHSGTLVRPMQARKFDGLKVAVILNGYLIWRQTHAPDYFHSPYVDLNNTDDVLLQFIRLHNAPPEAILFFARKWGVLGICKHSRPASHNPELINRPKSRPPCEPLRMSGDLYGEPLEMWRRYSRQARAILKIAARLHQDRRGSDKDWDTVYESEPSDQRVDHMGEIGVDRMMLTFVINQWLELGNVRPRFRWFENKISVAYDCTLFSIIAMQLMLVISRTKGIGVCSSCGEPFIPQKRRPKVDQRNYCRDPECGRTAACRDAKRDQRQRQRARRNRRRKQRDA